VSSERDEITDVLHRYATAIDRKDWALFRTCWTEDATVDYSQFGSIPDVDALTELFRTLHDNMGPTYHQMSNIVIDVDGDRATVRSYVHAVLTLMPGDPNNWVDAVGHYDDVLVKTADGWRISHRASHTARTLAGGEIATAAVSQMTGN
jgi:ketosteroid isomerase-like protein